jgi:putative FmdB family regulatory protein
MQKVKLPGRDKAAAGRDGRIHPPTAQIRGGSIRAGLCLPDRRRLHHRLSARWRCRNRVTSGSGTKSGIRSRLRDVPLFDFTCRACGHEFEALVRAGSPPACPSCGGTELQKQLPTFAVSSSERTRAAADKKIRKDAAVARRDNVAMDREIERHRREDH